MINKHHKTGGKMKKYRIENIQKVYFNNRLLKSFRAFKFESSQNAYIFCGLHYAPAKTSNKNLVNFITESNGYCKY